MNHTPNYNLPQWELNDLIKMEDFNGAMNSIEGGIAGAKAEALQAAAEAQATANSAKVTANAAKSAADTALAAKHYVTGHYTGTGGQVTVTLGFRPSFVIVSGMKPSSSTTTIATFDRYFAMTAGNTMKGRLDITSSGFAVYGITTSIMPYLSEEGRVYDYIAFK